MGCRQVVPSEQAAQGIQVTDGSNDFSRAAGPTVGGAAAFPARRDSSMMG